MASRGRQCLQMQFVVTLLWVTALPPLVARVVSPTPSNAPETSDGAPRRKLEPGYVPDEVKPVLLKPENVQPDPIDKYGDQKGDTDHIVKQSPLQVRSVNTSFADCNLWATDPEIYDKISQLVKGGAKLLEYNLDFVEYEINPLKVNMSTNFMTTRWARAFTKHGKTLLSLSFNYAILSLSMLSFGVEKINVGVVDSPKKCFGKFTPEQKLKKVMDVVMSDFRMAFEERQWVGEFDYACHQIIEEDDDKVAHFKYQCCERLEEGTRIRCTNDISVKWITMMFVLIVILKITAFMVGPLFLQSWAYSESLQQADYLVKLKEPMQKSILVKKIKVPGENSAGSSGEMKEFSKFRGIVKNIPPERIHFVSFRKLQVQVDARRLMTEKSVPVGLFTFLYENVIWCGIRRWEPFFSCCKESIFGSCSPRFLWIKLRKRSECNNSCKKFCSWEHVFNMIGGLLLLLAIPIPYYIRVAIYYAYEEDDIVARKEAIKQLDLKYPWEHTLIHYVDPSHAGMVLLYITYGLSFVLLAAFRSCNASKFDPIAVGAVEDMRNVNRVECFRLLLAHIILPFEKFGLCGFIVAAIYWPIVIPICIFVSICYCTPTLYLLGRFLIHNRPKFLRNSPIPTSPNHYSYRSSNRHTLSKGTTSFETCLLLENISPENKEATNESCFSCEINRQACYTAFLSVIVGLLCSVFMLSVLLLFADVLGFIVEVFVFTLMGAIVNASSAAKYLMLAFWIMVYSSSCLNNVYNKYMDLNDHLFKFIKAKLKEDIKEVTMLREDMQKNTAFKYFNQADFKELRDMEIEEELDSDFETEHERQSLIGKYTGYGSNGDGIEYLDDKLHWRVHNLVLFVDNADVPRIPKTLFHEICKLNAPGCPGPFHLSLLEGLKQLSYMVIFIFFVLVTVMAFGDAYKLSSTNQLMVTLAGGFLPFVVRFVIKPKQANIDLNSYSFEGKIHQIIYKFNEVWPVYDLSFKVDSIQDPHPPAPAPDGHVPGDHDGEGEGEPGCTEPPPGALIGHRPYIQGPSCGAHCHVEGSGCGTSEPTHVDLLITIRDEVDENLHQEPGSFGSRGSLPPDNSLPPEDPGSSSYGINNPTNATMSNPERRFGSGGFSGGGYQSTGLTYPSGGSSYQSAETQTGEAPITRSWAQPSYTSTSTQVLTPPGTRPVDLMVDLNRGGVRVRNQTSLDGGGPENGIVMRQPRGSPYKRVPSQQSKDESSV